MNEEEKKIADALEAATKNETLPDDVKIVLGAFQKIRGDFSNVVEDLKGERQKKQDALAELAKVKAGQGGDNKGNDDVEAIVNKKLAEKELASAQNNRQSAELTFKNKHKEFTPENDPGGIKFAALQEKLKRFSTEGLTTERDFLSVYGDAYELLMKKPAEVITDYNPYASTSQNNGAGPKDGDKNNLTPKEERLVKSLGWTPDRYLKQKASKPSFIDGLLDSFKG